MTIISKETLFFMVIDDDHLNNIICQTIITRHYPQAKYITFINPAQALEYLQNANNEQPDIIFLDIHMPDVNGWSFLERFQKLSTLQKAHIIMISSSINYKDVNGASEHPLVKDYIEKPITIDNINKALERVLG